LSPLAKALREAGPWLDATGRLTGGVVVGVVAGWLVDRWMGWQPWGLLGCAALGITAGMIGFFTSILKLMGKKK
jgi:ATP synthase protein I